MTTTTTTHTACECPHICHTAPRCSQDTTEPNHPYHAQRADVLPRKLPWGTFQLCAACRAFCNVAAQWNAVAPQGVVSSKPEMIASLGLYRNTEETADAYASRWNRYMWTAAEWCVTEFAPRGQPLAKLESRTNQRFLRMWLRGFSAQDFPKDWPRTGMSFRHYCAGLAYRVELGLPVPVPVSEPVLVFPMD